MYKTISHNLNDTESMIRKYNSIYNSFALNTTLFLFLLGLIFSSCSSGETVTPAVLKASQKMVIFDVDGGSPIESALVDIGEKLTKPANPTKTGFVFDNWYKNTEKTVTFNFDTENINETITLYANWKLEEFEVSFNLDSGTGTIETQKIIKGGKATRPVTAPTRQGYVFRDWYKDDAKTIVFDFTNEIIVATTVVYAKWETGITVTFDFKGGEGPTATQDVLSGGKLTKPENPTRQGYFFSGWYKDAETTTLFLFANETITTAITIYAKWNRVYTITFNLNAPDATGTASVQEVAHGTKLHVPRTPIRPHYTFVDWVTSTEPNAPNFDVTQKIYVSRTIYAKWTRIIFTATFDLNGGNNEPPVPAQSINSGELVTRPTITPVRVGHDFVDWVSTSTGSVPFNFGEEIITRNTIIYAKWTKTIYNVFFNLNASDATGTIETQRVAYQTKAKKPTVTPMREGYLFATWVTSTEANATEYNFSTTHITGEITLYAKWGVPITVTFNPNGGTYPNGGTANITVEIATGTKVSPIVATENPKLVDNFMTGWYKGDATDVLFDFNQTLTENTTLHAKWIDNQTILNSIKNKLSPDNKGYPSSTVTRNNGSKTVIGSPINTPIDKTLKEVLNHFLKPEAQLTDEEISYVLHNIDTGGVTGKFSFRIGLGDRRFAHVARYEVALNWSGETKLEEYLLLPDALSSSLFNHKLIFKPTITNSKTLRVASIKLTDNHYNSENTAGSIRSFELRINP